MLQELLQPISTQPAAASTANPRNLFLHQPLHPTAAAGVLAAAALCSAVLLVCVVWCDVHNTTQQVLFHAASQKLISASEDGLVAVHDVSAGLNQDDGFIAALNIGTSVSQLGLYGPGGQHMWCRTGAMGVGWLVGWVPGWMGMRDSE